MNLIERMGDRDRTSNTPDAVFRDEMLTKKCARKSKFYKLDCREYHGSSLSKISFKLHLGIGKYPNYKPVTRNQKSGFVFIVFIGQPPFTKEDWWDLTKGIENPPLEAFRQLPLP
jgi:hypothetical protein